MVPCGGGEGTGERHEVEWRTPPHAAPSSALPSSWHRHKHPQHLSWLTPPTLAMGTREPTAMRAMVATTDWGEAAIWFRMEPPPKTSAAAPARNPVTAASRRPRHAELGGARLTSSLAKRMRSRPLMPCPQHPPAAHPPIMAARPLMVSGIFFHPVACGRPVVRVGRIQRACMDSCGQPTPEQAMAAGSNTHLRSNRPLCKLLQVLLVQVAAQRRGRAQLLLLKACCPASVPVAPHWCPPAHSTDC